MTRKSELERKYQGHKTTAAAREIEFLFTLDEWIKMWVDSGHWSERGKGSNQYCMARHNDVGPYSVENVSIITNKENQKIRIDNLSEATRTRMSASAAGNKSHLGCIHDSAAREKMRLARIRGLESHPNTKLTASIALEIFNSDLHYREAAKKYNIDPSMVRSIRKGKAWVHATGFKGN